MKWQDTIANKCRYGEVAESIWGDWDVIWEHSEADYQGHASFVATLDGRYAFYEWWYGSCSGCDSWEAENKADWSIEQEMRDTAMWFDSKEQVLIWLNMLESTGHATGLSNHSYEGAGLVAALDVLSGGLLDRVNAIRAHFGMSAYGQSDDIEKP